METAEALDRVSLEAFRTWIHQERIALWTDFEDSVAVTMRHHGGAIDPKRPRTWSMHMEWIVERIREASGLLGDNASWGDLPWKMYPFYETVEGVPLPEDAWNYVDEELQDGHFEPSERLWVLSFRPKA